MHQSLSGCPQCYCMGQIVDSCQRVLQQENEGIHRVVRPSLKLFENKRAMYDYTCIHNFSALKYENECIHTMHPRFQFLRMSVQGMLILPILKMRTLWKLVQYTCYVSWLHQQQATCFTQQRNTICSEHHTACRSLLAGGCQIAWLGGAKKQYGQKRTYSLCTYLLYLSNPKLRFRSRTI